VTNLSSSLRRVAVAVLVVATPSIAIAQADYPSRTIKIVVPLAAGGVADIVPRMLADKLSAKWAQPVIIENRPGAGHNVGAEAVAKAEPDGYTLLATPQGPLVTSQLLYPKLGFDPTAFVPISILTTGNIVLIVSSKVPASNLRELIAYAKANPGKLTFASPGAGTSPHLTGEMLNALAGISTTHVPYRGLGPAVTDLLAGHVDMMFDNLGNSLPHIRDGKTQGARRGRRDAYCGAARRAGDCRDLSWIPVHQLARGGRAAENAARYRGQALAGVRRGAPAA
jgi:tripartite-type tricarboxylate transporter receptor subunit TctC